MKSESWAPSAITAPCGLANSAAPWGIASAMMALRRSTYSVNVISLLPHALTSSATLKASGTNLFMTD